jgi:hypothetical protein
MLIALTFGLSACGAASVVDIRSNGSTPPGIEVVDGTGTEPDISVPAKTDAQRTVPPLQETAIGDGWNVMLIDSLRATDKEFQKQFPSAPDLGADKQYLVALVQLRYVGSEPIKPTDSVGAFILDSFSKSLGEPCAVPLAEFVSTIDVPAGQAAAQYRCFVVDRTIGTDVVLGVVNTKGTPTVARFRLDEPATGSVFTPFDAATPFAVDDYLITVNSAKKIAEPAPGTVAVLIKLMFTVADTKPGAVGQLRFGLMSPGRGAVATTDCERHSTATPGTATSSAAGELAICVTDRTGTGTLTGWVQAPKTGTIVFFDVSAQ